MTTDPSAPPARRWRIGRAALTTLAGAALIGAVLMLLGLILVHLLAPVRHWDDHINSWVAARRTRGWNRVSADGTFLANTLGVVVIAGLVTLFALLRRWGRAAALLVTGLAVELAVFLAVNTVVARPRPSAPHLGPTPSTYSFPSGHVAATLVLYGGIAVLVACRTASRAARAAACALAVIMVAWVGCSRVYEAQHHPTDVLAGALLGAGALAVAVRAIQPPRRAERTVTAGRAVPTSLARSADAPAGRAQVAS